MRMIFSSVLAMGDSSEMGRYEVPSEESLLGFCIGMILANFHV